MKLKLKLKWVSWCWTSWSFNAKFFMRYNCSFDKVVVFPFLLVLILCSWTLIYFNYDTATEFSNFPCVLIIWSLSLSVCARACAQHKRMCACVCMLACLHMLVIFFVPTFVLRCSVWFCCLHLLVSYVQAQVMLSEIYPGGSPKTGSTYWDQIHEVGVISVSRRVLKRLHELLEQVSYGINSF